MANDLLCKQIYWSSPRLRTAVRKYRAWRRSAPQVVDRDQLKQHLRQIGVVEGALVMAHTSVSNLHFRENPENKQSVRGYFQVAHDLLNDLLELVGPNGTLVMPTHAHYQMDDLERPEAERQWAIPYDPLTTPSCVGLANELFWRRKGVLRSLHPYNTLAACGPLAEELFRDNLNRHMPLPHGIYSGYYRLAQHNGLVVSVGVSLRDCMTLLHVGEDVRDQEWPIKDFFEQRRYYVRINNQDELYIVRQRRPKYAKYCAYWWRAFGDLIREGILHEATVDGVPVGWARAGEVLEYLMRRNKNSTYPYSGAWLAALRS
jgi:aminoglycoside N3'-acetyltransferase